MKIEHIGIWVNNLNLMKDFYTRYFDLTCSNLYRNEKKGFSSYFLSSSSGARIELMNMAGVSSNQLPNQNQYGLAHIAFSSGSKQNVNELTEILRTDGFEVISEPRITGDGYYESVVLDPEKNKIEITE